MQVQGWWCGTARGGGGGSGRMEGGGEVRGERGVGIYYAPPRPTLTAAFSNQAMRERERRGRMQERARALLCWCAPPSAGAHFAEGSEGAAVARWTGQACAPYYCSRARMSRSSLSAFRRPRHSSPAPGPPPPIASAARIHGARLRRPMAASGLPRLDWMRMRTWSRRFPNRKDELAMTTTHAARTTRIGHWGRKRGGCA